MKFTSNDCVLISHHGNALLEGAFLGFKCISSSSTPWQKYNLFNSWNNKADYANLLLNLNGLAYTNTDDLLGYIGKLYGTDSSFFTEKSWPYIAAQYLGCKPIDLFCDPSLINSLNERELQSIILETTNNINSI